MANNSSRLKRNILLYSLVFVFCVQAASWVGFINLGVKAKIDLMLTLCIMIAGYSIDLFYKNEELEINIQNLIKKNFLAIRDHVPIEIEKVLGTKIQKDIDNLSGMLHEGSYFLFDTKLFTSCYKQTFIKFPKSTFLATSNLHNSLFWDATTNTIIQSFIKQGGTMKRIFFVSSRDQKLNDQELSIILQQLKAGVAVSFIPLDEIPSNYFDLYIVEQKERIAWKVFKDTQGSIIGSEAHTSNDYTKKCIENFNHLINHPALGTFDMDNKKVIY